MKRNEEIVNEVSESCCRHMAFLFSAFHFFLFPFLFPMKNRDVTIFLLLDGVPFFKAGESRAVIQP